MRRVKRDDPLSLMEKGECTTSVYVKVIKATDQVVHTKKNKDELKQNNNNYKLYFAEQWTIVCLTQKN